jgi:hypothetical protein
VAVGLTVCAAMVFLNVHMRPFLDTYQNSVNILLLTQLSLTLFVGMMLKVKTLDQGSTAAEAVAVVLVILNCVIFVLPFLNLVLFVGSFFGAHALA